MKTKQVIAAIVIASLALTGAAQDAEEDDEPNDALAAAAQNPLASLISLPLQNNTTFGSMGGDVHNTLNIQPVYPFTLNDDWNLITRTIVPQVSAPSPDGQLNGLGDTTLTAWASPRKTYNNWTLGAGPVLYAPTATRSALGKDQWGAGPSLVAAWIDGPWVAGGLANNVWGFDDTDDLNAFLFQYFVNYNLDDGWYLVSAPIMTADWNASSDDQWVIPVGGGIGKIVRIGKLPININLQIFQNIEKPDGYGDYTARIQAQFMFPKK